MRRIVLWIIEKLYPLTYRRTTLDQVNHKLIRPVPGLLLDGVQYYQFVQVADMPQERFVAYLQFRNELNMGVDRDLLNRYIDKLKEANNKNDSSQIGSLLYMLQDTVNNCTPMEALFNIASLLYFDKEEDLRTYDIDYNAHKIARFKAVRDKSFFFTNLLENGLKLTGAQLPPDIEKSLRLSALRLTTYAQILSEKSD